MKLHFISGLPRSGSTLLATLLRQNPRVHAAMSSPVAQLTMRLQHAMSRGSEGSVFVTDEQRKRMLRGLMANYYVGNRDVVFDTNRMWCAKMPLIAELFPESKVICCVRDLGWIVNSIEKLLQANPLQLSGIFDYQTSGTVFSRAAGLASPDGMVGYAVNAVREAYFGPFANRIMLVEYEALARDPATVLNTIYEFTGEQTYEHDFENLEYEAEEFDADLGTPGLHTVKGPVRWKDQDPVLPRGLMFDFSQGVFWRDQNQNLRQVKVIYYDPPQPKSPPLRIVGAK